MKILHVLDHYKPSFSGYVFRSNYILKNQQKIGIKPVVLTSPKQVDTTESVEEINGLRVYRTSNAHILKQPFLGEMHSMRRLEKKLLEVIKQEKPDIIHAHSPSLNGWPALRAAKKNDIPCVYEIRAFWEDAAVDKGSFKEGDLKYNISAFVEKKLMERVDFVFTICEGLKKEIIRRGLGENKIEIIPNCVDLSQFSKTDYNNEIADKFNLQGRYVFGFIGSLYQFEGIDLLINAYAQAKEELNNSVVLIVGDGPMYEDWRQMVKSQNLDKNIIFIGKVPHEEVSNYYSVMNAMVYPRSSMRLTELVTPLKPLEAMALEKIVVGSDVGGIGELVKDQQTGFLFKSGDINALTDTLLQCIKRDSASNEKIIQNALAYVKQERDWSKIIQRYLPVYESLLK